MFKINVLSNKTLYSALEKPCAYSRNWIACSKRICFVIKNADCDGDGILDHACMTRVNENL